MTSPAQPTSFDENPLLNYFIRNGGHQIHKWVDYFEVYHRVFQRFRGKRVKFLEIGIQNGGSARMWRDYFGPDATIIGIDIDPRCKALESDEFEVWIGDQGSPDFWRGFLEKHPRIDLVLDDGGHTMTQQIASFNALFPALTNNGLFLCEDTHTSYFPAHGGGLGQAGTFHEYIKGLIDDMHAWYHAPLAALPSGQAPELPGAPSTKPVVGYLAQNLYSISVYDSIVAIEKRLKNPPLVLARGFHAHTPNPGSMTHLDMRRGNGVAD